MFYYMVWNDYSGSKQSNPTVTLNTQKLHVTVFEVV